MTDRHHFPGLAWRQAPSISTRLPVQASHQADERQDVLSVTGDFSKGVTNTGGGLGTRLAPPTRQGASPLSVPPFLRL